MEKLLIKNLNSINGSIVVKLKSNYKNMKKTVIFAICATFISTTQLSAQILKGVLRDAKSEISGNSTSSPLSQEEVGSGLKEALTRGIEAGVAQLSKPDGYFKDMAIKILMPEEAKNVESKLRALGQGKLVDDAIESMNRAAEQAADGAKDIFVAAIKSMTLQDAMSILRGADDAATQYLNKSTRAVLTEKFRPVIKVALDKVGATSHWNAVFTTYNKIPFVNKVNPDLEQFVTEKALDGLFVQIAKQEKEIRKNPAARVSDLLKKVFG